ncbi:MAG: hypothetical protein DPW21_01485 [Anaerolineae bacterium]|nr:hypothetical protein [Anaerolineae bacterium]RIK24850.1 MAG: hypothetical protein DCC54_12525 [Anaerolineae bacterium]
MKSLAEGVEIKILRARSIAATEQVGVNDGFQTLDDGDRRGRLGRGRGGRGRGRRGRGGRVARRKGRRREVRRARGRDGG